MDVSIVMAFWQLLNIVALVGVIYVVVKLVKNSSETVQLLREINEKLGKK